MLKNYQTVGLTLALLSFNSVHGGKLVEIYEGNLHGEAHIESAEFIAKAAEQRVTTEKRGYLPRVNVNVKELWVEQDIDQDGSGVFEEGRDSYENTRAKIEIDQPLIDLTLKPKVDTAKALHQRQQHLLSMTKAEQTRKLLQDYLEASQYHSLKTSYQRVITRLNSELEKVSKSFDEKIATVEDVENIKASLAAMQQEQRINEEKLKFKLLDLGIDTESLNNGWLALKRNANLNGYAPAASQTGDSYKLQALQAEVSAYDKRITATTRKDLPRLALYGMYQHDNADGSEFGGGGRRLSGYEVGLSLNWDIFDRGINRSEAKELTYLKRAKEANMRIVAAEEKREEQIAELSTKLAKSNLANLGELVEHKNKIREAAERAFESGGSQSYISMINAFLVYEAQVRQFTIGHHASVDQQINLLGNQSGWNSELVAAVDALFAKN